MAATDQGRNFASDNTAPAAPEVVEAILAANRGAADSYGADTLTQHLTALAREVFETDLAIFPVATGTAANGLALATLSPPYGAVYCHETAHILLEECGGPEFYTGGAKVVGLPGPGGKLQPDLLAEALKQASEAGVHCAAPAALSLTQATEWGTVYRPDEIETLASLARGRSMRLHMDGARFANAVARLGCAPAATTWRAGVDVLSLGATKNGALAAEAVVVFDPALTTGLAERRKRGGHLLSKMRFVSAQLVAMLEQDRWLRYGAHANAMADRLAAGLIRVPGLRLVQPVEANELFLVMPEPMVAALRGEGFLFHRWLTPPGLTEPVVRLVTSFATLPTDVDELVEAAVRLGAQGAR
jgi:threonine aldolase